MLIPYQRDKSYWLFNESSEHIKFDSNKDLVQTLIKERECIGKELLDYISFLNSLLNDIGELSPPIREEELLSPGGIHDKRFENDLNSWIDYTFESKTLDDYVNLEDFELIPLSKYAHEEVNINDINYWVIIDTSDGDKKIDIETLEDLCNTWNISTDCILHMEGLDLPLIEDEYDASDIALGLNLNMTEPIHNYPFAWNTYWKVPSYIPIDLIQDAGFIVYNNIEDSSVYMGIDGGGYDFMSHHWAPLYISYCVRNRKMVDTINGPRYVDK